MHAVTVISDRDGKGTWNALQSPHARDPATRGLKGKPRAELRTIENNFAIICRQKSRATLFAHCHSSFISTPIKKLPSRFRKISSRSTKNLRVIL
eukprot:sb/3479251/